MSLYGTMRTGVSGMNAQANRLGTVGDNIANSSTIGYKKASTQFSSMILPSSNGSYNSGGVDTVVRYSINDQGSFSYTTSSTDLAINGEGFFIVEGADGADYLTRAGNFEVQDDGTLKNAAGYKLMGYPYSSTEDPTIVINGFQGLSEINVSAGGLQATPSKQGSLSGNLPTNEAVGYTKSSSVVAYDSQGNSRLLNLTYTKTADNTWTLDVQYNGVSVTGQAVTASTTSAVSGNLNNTAATGTTYTTKSIAYGSDGAAHTLSYNYTKTAAGWNLDVLDGTTSVGTSALTFDGAGNLTSSSSLTTTANGTLGALTVDLSGLKEGSSVTSVSGSTNGNGSGYELSFGGSGKLTSPTSITTTAQSIGGATLSGLTIDLTGLSQLGSAYSAEGDIDGKGASAVDKVEISKDGIVSILYKNGQSIPSYRIAMANVQSPNNLTPLAGNVYTQSNDSGVIVMGYAGTSGYGQILSGALENSNVDIGEELTSMIEAQRNYTANSKVFQTGSELLETLVNLKR
ncbi:flagellar hook protein FlgE [Rhizobium sp. RU35A]|uniref:flagellar hook protein FlgE n=1 Tax=Rhizobium sp. RU35A TaxID=1907414 RepID=UPI0009567E55|nr:flagellar hook protein FlgE [Rhizobium sp. RU35A]SIQ02290.1 flagellar hook protein FlgE [Rhizobium sp. RU35A]